MDYIIYVTDLHILYEVNLYVKLIHHLKYDIIVLKIEGEVTDPHIFHEVNLFVTLIHYPEYNIYFFK